MLANDVSMERETASTFSAFTNNKGRQKLKQGARQLCHASSSGEYNDHAKQPSADSANIESEDLMAFIRLAIMYMRHRHSVTYSIKRAWKLTRSVK